MLTRYITENDFKRKYSTEKLCMTALLNYRMSPDGRCFNPSCNAHVREYKYMSGSARKAFLCPRCLGHYYPMVDSIFDHTHIKIEDWFNIIFKMLSSRNGISANEIQRITGHSYCTGFNIIHKIREQMGKSLDFIFEDTNVECDESGVRTGNKGMNKNTYLGTGRGNKKQSGVFVIAERGGLGRVKLFAVRNAESETLIPIIKENVAINSAIYTDKWGAYNPLKSLGYTHETVNHSEKFKDGLACTNTAENVFSNLKRVIRGTHRNVSHRKLQNYLDENSFRLSYRNEEDYGFDRLLKSLTSLSDNYGNKIAA